MEVSVPNLVKRDETCCFRCRLPNYSGKIKPSLKTCGLKKAVTACKLATERESRIRFINTNGKVWFCMNATVAYSITVGSLAAMLLGYQGHYLIGILGIIVYVIALLCALGTAVMRGDTAMVLCIIFIPLAGLLFAIAKYCDSGDGKDSKKSKNSENSKDSEGNISSPEGCLLLFLAGGGLTFGGFGVIHAMATVETDSVATVILGFIPGVLMALAGIYLLLGALGAAKSK